MMSQPSDFDESITMDSPAVSDADRGEPNNDLKHVVAPNTVDIDIAIAAAQSMPSPIAERFLIYTELKSGDRKITGVNKKLLAEYIINQYHYLTGKNVFYRYVEGIYKPDYGESINMIVEDIMGPHANIHLKNEVLAIIRDTSRIRLDITKLSLANTNLIAFDNCVYNRETRAYAEHSPDNFLMSKLNVKYDPGAVSVDAIKMLTNIFGDDLEDELEYLGYALTNTNWLDKIAFYVGDGSNGRTYYMKWLRGMFGAENCVAADPHALSDDRFAGVGLVGKQLCLVADIGSDPIKHFNKLKQYSTIDEVSVQDKGEKAFDALLYAKFFYGCNEMPYIKDKTYGAVRRQRIVVLKRLFSSTDADYDPKIANRAMNDEEYSGMVNLILPALERLTERGGFNELRNTAEFSHKLSRPVYAFTEECIEVTGDNSYRGDRALMGDVLDLNELWCMLNHFPFPDRDAYSEKFVAKLATQGVSKKQTTKGGIRGTYVFGIKIEQTFDQLLSTYISDEVV